jgi:hypothetical protein
MLSRARCPADTEDGQQKPDSKGRGGVEGGKWKGKAPTRLKPGKKALAAAAEMSQLLDGYMPPPSSAALLDN